MPESRAFPDSEDLLGEALVALSRSGTPSAREVLVGLAVPSDEIRWWRDVPTGPADATSWTVEEHLRAAARQTLLAGALATRARAGYYGARYRRTAAASLENVLVGSAAGGRRLTAFVPVGTTRPLAVRLHQALYATREAIDYQRATGGMDAFDGAVEAGVSRELTEALIALVRGTEGARIAVEWAPAAASPKDARRPPRPWSSRPATCPCCARPGPASCARSPPSRFGSPARWSGCAGRGRAGTGRYGCG